MLGYSSLFKLFRQKFFFFHRVKTQLINLQIKFAPSLSLPIAQKFF